MRHTMNIISIISEVQLPATVLEDFVNHRTRNRKYNHPVTGIDKNLFARSFETITIYSIQATAKGRLQIRFTNERSGSSETIQIPTASAFLVTCIKGREDKYKMKVISSLN